MKAIGVIPARLASTRLKAKVLADIGGKPMVQHVWERARQSRRLNDVLIACDDEAIVKVAAGFGAKAVLTSKDHKSGTDRVAEAVKTIDADIVVNIQGDEPLIHHSVIDDLVAALLKDSSCLMATAIKKLDRNAELNNPNLVKVIIDKNKNAQYFSRADIPYNRDNRRDITYYKHLGIYAYQRDFLFRFVKELPRSLWEEAEQLEQLRALENGACIKTVLTDVETIAVDTAEDLKRVKEKLGVLR